VLRKPGLKSQKSRRMVRLPALMRERDPGTQRKVAKAQRRKRCGDGSCESRAENMFPGAGIQSWKGTESGGTGPWPQKGAEKRKRRRITRIARICTKSGAGSRGCTGANRHIWTSQAGRGRGVKGGLSVDL